MSFWKKTSFHMLFSTILIINVIVYTATLNRPAGMELGAFSDPDSWRSIFYITERNGPNIYTAGSPFESQVNRYLLVDGCPCPDAPKVIVLADLIATRAFFLNALVWAIPISLGAYALRRNYR